MPCVDLRLLRARQQIRATFEQQAEGRIQEGQDWALDLEA